MEEDTSTTHPWPPPPPLARSKYYQPTAGRICCALPTHTAERGTKDDHGPALGKLQGRCHSTTITAKFGDANGHSSTNHTEAR